MIALKPWKIGIARRTRLEVFFGMSYVSGFGNPNYLLRPPVIGFYHENVFGLKAGEYDIYRGFRVDDITWGPAPEPESVFFSGNILGNVE